MPTAPKPKGRKGRAPAPLPVRQDAAARMAAPIVHSWSADRVEPLRRGDVASMIELLFKSKMIPALPAVDTVLRYLPPGTPIRVESGDRTLPDHLVPYWRLPKGTGVTSIDPDAVGQAPRLPPMIDLDSLLA